MLFEAESDLSVIGEASDGEAALALAGDAQWLSHAAAHSGALSPPP